MFNMPGYNPPGETFHMQDDSENMGQPTAAAYKIPPALWPVIFLVVAYIGFRLVME